MEKKKINYKLAAFLLLPLLLWPLSFIVLRPWFVYAMAASTIFLGSLSLLWFRSYIRFNTKSIAYAIAVGAIASAGLYLIFFFGNIFVSMIGLSGQVSDVYEMLYAGNRVAIAVILPFIAVFEEIYWRGGLQGYARKRSKIFSKAPWVASTAYYSLIHLSTLNPVLPLAAFAVGLVASLIAEKYGIVASSIAHVIWIEAIVIFLPVI